jgi:hypothetical protein
MPFPQETPDKQVCLGESEGYLEKHQTNIFITVIFLKGDVNISFVNISYAELGQIQLLPNQQTSSLAAHLFHD